MATYTKPVIANLNDNPPTNDGSTNFSDNGVDWDKNIIDEIATPLENYIDAVNNATSTAFGKVDANNSVSVLDYGAVGDGVTDDGPAFQSAINAINTRGYGDIIVPYKASGYSWETAVNMNNMDGIVLRGVGSGYNAPVIQWNGAVSTDMLTMNSSRYCGVRNINMDCNSIADSAIYIYWDGVSGGGTYECIFKELYVDNGVVSGISLGSTANYQASEIQFESVMLTNCATGFLVRGQNTQDIYVERMKLLSNATGMDIQGAGVIANDTLWLQNSTRDLLLESPQQPCIFTGGWSEGSERFLEIPATGTNFQATFIGILTEASASGDVTTFIRDASLHHVTWINCTFDKAANCELLGFTPIPASSTNGIKRFIGCRWTDASSNDIFPALTTNAPTASSICVDADTRHSGPQPFSVDGSLTPTVFGSNIWKTANTVPTTITNLILASYGQIVTIIIGDANTTIDFSGSNMKGNAGVDKTFAVGDSVRCVFDGTNWLCTLSLGS